MGAWSVALVGAVVMAVGAGVRPLIKKDEISGERDPQQKNISWGIVSVGLLVLVVGVLIAGAHLDIGGPGGGRGGSIDDIKGGDGK